MFRTELSKNTNVIIATIVLIVATIYYFAGRPDNMSEETRYLASLIFYLALAGYNLMVGIYFTLSKKWEARRASHFFFSPLATC